MGYSYPRHSGAMQSIELRCAIAHRRNLQIPGLVLTHHPGMTGVNCFASLAMTRTDQRGPHTATTSSLITTNFFSSIRPKLVVSATSAASRPVPIRMRPIRG